MCTIHNLLKIKEKRKFLRNNATPQEILLWNRLKGGVLDAKFRRQHSIGNYIVDFCCPNFKLIVELDGFQHGEKSGEENDSKRTEYLRKLGFKVLRFWNNEINVNLEGVLMKIKEGLHTTPDPSSSKEGRRAK